jgi:hypothetical protein
MMVGMKLKLQFRLRTLLIGIGLVALWLGWSVNSASRQRRAVREILDRGGIVFYDYQLARGSIERLPDAVSPHPKWLRWLLGDDYFHDVVWAGFDKTATNDDFAIFERLPKLRAVLSCGGHVTDAGLAHL